MASPELQFYEYNTWANHQVFNRLKELPTKVYQQEIQSVFPTIAHVLAHVYLSDHSWLEVFSGKSLKDALKFAEQQIEQTASKQLAEMETMFEQLSNRYTSFLKQAENVNKPLAIENPSGEFIKYSISELLIHVVNHGTYHRGNITAMLRQIGYASVPTDYGLYLYLNMGGQR
ncbi:DinB family protein [Bacillus changyiensis]|uniref:DinB family protein n=1 Tax=Bacillus changyiensis TaxID=3004103 RepID=UPI0022E58764|nr:DinB family protein [Bacillus changyiensis]MDA1478008.1 DinB family protein [Bacillus changyiensis]